jgi:hypothetical protein
MRVPDGHAGTTAVFKSPFVVNLPYSGVWDAMSITTNDVLDGNGVPIDGYSEVILAPGSVNCIYHTLGDQAPLFTGDTSALTHIVGETAFLIPTLATHPAPSDRINGWVTLAHGLQVTGTSALVQHVCSLPKRDELGNAWHEILCTPANDKLVEWNMLIALRNLAESSGLLPMLKIQYRYENGNIGETIMPLDAGGTSFGAFDIPVDGGTGESVITAFSLSVNDADPGSHYVATIVSGSPFMPHQSADFTIPRHSATGFANKDAPELDELNETLTERPSALSGLITYVGSTLQDGGQVAAARLGMGLGPFTAPRGDVFTYLASLPFYSDDFALREGVYSWWLPDSIQEHFYKPYRTPRTTILQTDQILHFAMHRDNPNQAVRLKSVHGIEVITRSRLYASAPGASNPSYEVMIGALKHVPAVTINSKHKGILSRIFGSIKSWVSKPSNWANLLRIGGSLVGIVNPGVGAGMTVGGEAIDRIEHAVVNA